MINFSHLFILFIKGSMKSGGICMFFQTKQHHNESVNNEDLYSQLQFIVSTMLKNEIPSHFTAHHLLYTANSRLEELRQLTSYHRQHINLNTSIGTFHKDAYEITTKNYHQFELIIDSYISLNIENDRDLINHRLSLLDDKINTLYIELIEYKKHEILHPLKETFWHAYKEDLMPILAELRGG